MKRLLAIALAAGPLLAGATSVLADPPAPAAAPPKPVPGIWSLERREYWLERRIRHGEADGSLDAPEAARVRHELTDIRYQEQRLRAVHGGRLVDSDRLRLEAMVDRLSAEIHWLRENGERRPW